MLTLTTSIIILKAKARTIKKEYKIKSTQTEKKEVKLFLFAHGLLVILLQIY